MIDMSIVQIYLLYYVHPSALKKSNIIIRVALRSCTGLEVETHVNCENLSHNTTSYLKRVIILFYPLDDYNRRR